MIILKRTSNIAESKKVTVPLSFELVNVLSWHKTDTIYYELCPYSLKTDGLEENGVLSDVIFENYWQSSKIFEYVYDVKVYPHYSFKNKPEYLWWKYSCPKGKELHFDKNTNTITSEYYNWRNSLWQCPHPIRYPNGRNRTKLTLFSLGYVLNGNVYEERRYNYIEARKDIYMKEYIRLIRKLPIYQELLIKVKNGQNILITEVDLPELNKKGYYGKFVDSDNIYRPTLGTLNLLLKDSSEPFGHGLCLAYALLEDISKN